MEPNSGKLLPLRPSPPTSEQESPKPQSNRLRRLPRLRSAARPLRILDFDIENRPLSYWYDGQCTAEVTAIACCWNANDKVAVWLLGLIEPEDMLRNFAAHYAMADIVTGHFVRKHDLPILNGAMAEYGLPLLGPKLVHDTRTEKVKWKDLPASQEALCEMLGIPESKYHMTQAQWRAANRLLPKGLQDGKRRVIGDVKQHAAMRTAMIERKWVHGPRMWYP